MSYRTRIAGLIILTVLGTTGCHSLKPTQVGADRPMPATYSNTGDTTNTAASSWQGIFSDAYLVSLIDTALAGNQDLKMALQRIRTAQASVLLNRGNMKPTVRAIAAASLNKYGDYTMDGAGNMTTPIYDGRMVPDNLPNYYIGLQTSWEIDVWGKLKNRKRAAMARFLASVEGKNAVVTALVAEVAAVYYELLSLDAQLAITEETIVLQENALEIVKVQKQVALTNELAVEQFEAQLAGTRSMRLELMMQVKENENRMNVLLGRYPQTITRSRIVMDGPLPLLVKAGIPSALLYNRPDVRKAEAEVLAAKGDIKVAKAAFYPSLSISAGAGLAAFKTGLLFTTPQSIVYNIIGNLVTPLINRGALNADLFQADAAQVSAIYSYRQTLVKAYSEVYTEMQRIENLEKIYEMRTRQVTTLTRSIETASELFKTGRSSYLEVLITQQNALQSKLERVNTRKKQLQATVTVYRAIGGGWR